MAFLFLVVLSLITAPTASFARSVSKASNYRAGTGLVFAQITHLGSGEVLLTSVPLAVGPWYHLSPSWSTGFEVRVTLDISNPQLISKGIDALLAYHLLGGPPSYFEGGGLSGTIKTFHQSLSVIAKAGYVDYSISDSLRPSQKVKGALLTLKGGTLLRWRSYEVEVVTTLLSAPAGTERLTESSFETLLGRRWVM